MSAEALVFMIGSWTFVLGLTAWCFHRVLRTGRRMAPPRLPSGSANETNAAGGEGSGT